MKPSWCIGAILLGGSLFATPSAAAASGDPPDAGETAEAADAGGGSSSSVSRARALSLTEAGLGLLVLPTARVCLSSGCQSGDLAFTVAAWQGFRVSPRWALGAGVDWGIMPVAVSSQVLPGNVKRKHSRGYMQLSLSARFYPELGDGYELWLGPELGWAVVNDMFRIDENIDVQKALVGPYGTSVRTEGVAVGIALGGRIQLAPRWSAGVALRQSIWLLPGSPASDTLANEASLTGPTLVFGVAATLAYQLPFW